MNLKSRVDRLEAEFAANQQAATDDDDPFWLKDGPKPLHDYWRALDAEFMADLSIDTDLEAVTARLMERHPMIEDILDCIWLMRQFPTPPMFRHLQVRLLNRAIDRLTKKIGEGREPIPPGDIPAKIQRDMENRSEATRLLIGPDSGESLITRWRTTSPRDPNVLERAGIGSAEAALLDAEAA